MFGGYLAIKRAQEDAYFTLNRLRRNYARLKELAPDNPLLSVLGLTEDPTTPGPDPKLCPVTFTYQFTPAFLERYVPSGETLQDKVNAMVNEDTAHDMLGGLKYKTELTHYITDLAAEVERIQATRELK